MKRTERFFESKQLLYDEIVSYLMMYGMYVYDLKEQNFYGYTGKYWKVVHQSHFEKRILLVLAESIIGTRMQNIIDLLKIKCSHQSFFDNWNENNLINMSNGVLDVNSFELKKHSSAYHFKSVLPIEYDVSAACPKWIKFITEVSLGMPEIESVLQELFGYCLVPGNDMQKFFILLGKGENGKSVYLEILRAILGLENTSSLSFNDLDSRFKVTELAGKLANITDESPSRKAVDSEKLKNLSAGGYFVADVKHKNPYQVKNMAKLIFAANSALMVKDSTHGYRRRMLVIPFKFSVSRHKRDNHLVEKLKKELSGVFNWAVLGLIRLNDNQQFTEDVLLEEAKEIFVSDTDAVKRFFDEQCSISDEHQVDCQELYTSYVGYSKTNGYFPCSNSEFGRRLQDYYPKVVKERKSKGARTYYYAGIKVITPSYSSRSY